MRVLGKLHAHRGRYIDHFDPLGSQADLIEELLGIFHSPFCVEITFQVMAIAFQSTGHHDPVSAILESF